MDYQTRAYQSSGEGNITSDFVVLGVFSMAERGHVGLIWQSLVKLSKESWVKGHRSGNYTQMSPGHVKE